MSVVHTAQELYIVAALVGLIALERREAAPQGQHETLPEADVQAGLPARSSFPGIRRTSALSSPLETEGQSDQVRWGRGRSGRLFR